jgi:hypothetical protein
MTGEFEPKRALQYQVVSLECDSSAKHAEIAVHQAYFGVGKRVLNVHNGGWDEYGGDWLDVLDILQRRCNGKRNCTFHVQDLGLRRHVQGQTNLLALAWRCGDKQTQNPAFPIDDGAYNLITVGESDQDVYVGCAP